MSGCPSGKVRYRTGGLARADLKKIRAAPRHDGGKPVREYPCPLCAGWHLTSTPI